tara:strand:- start:18477 stop:19388 length:912 start_codon:yes stop_codon:yes gene_type:complete
MLMPLHIPSFTGYPSLVSTDWLSRKLNNPNVKIIDASWHMPAANRNAVKEYKHAHIPSAVFFDIDDISNTDSPLPHMMPSADKMVHRMLGKGIDNSNHIVIYDNSDLGSAARAWYMFKTFGHEKVSILNGGFQKWLSEDRPTDNTTRRVSRGSFNAIKDDNAVRSIDQVLKNLISKKEQVIDARSNGRFLGTSPEPRAELKSGHMPHSFNVPFNQLLNEDKTYKSKNEIKQIFIDSGVDLNQKIITSCGSGITACVLLFSLHLIGHHENSLYDGSWAEWGGHPDTPVTKSLELINVEKYKKSS